MTTRVIPLLVLVLASSGSFSATAEATANPDWAAAEKAAKEAEVRAKAAADIVNQLENEAGKVTADPRDPARDWSHRRGTA
jgi:hypothetical protein